MPGPAVTEHDHLIQSLLERVADEQARLARVLDKLPGLLGTDDLGPLRVGLAEIARDVCGGSVALFVGQEEDDAEATVAPGEHRRVALPAVRRAPLLSAAFLADEVLRIDDVSRTSTAPRTRLYGSVDDDRLLRCWLAAPVVAAHPGSGRDGRDPRDGRPDTLDLAEGRSPTPRLGVLLVGHTRPHAFDARHEALLAAAARHLAVALENAALVAEHVRVAAGLQETLLPPMLPQIPGVDVASRYRPAGEDSVIGGDFYDVFPSRDGRWTAAIGDVCGVGPEAAAVTGIARYTLRAVAREDADPARAMVALNDAILSRRTESRFCTGVVLCIEPAAAGPGTAAVTWSSAGHPPPLLLRDNGSVETLDDRLGMLLGVMPDAPFAEATLMLRGGDALVLYTDGVIEARPADGDFFGEERLAALVAACAGRTADGIARRIELAVIDHLGGRATDDIAILVIRAHHRPAATL